MQKLLTHRITYYKAQRSKDRIPDIHQPISNSIIMQSEYIAIPKIYRVIYGIHLCLETVYSLYDYTGKNVPAHQKRRGFVYPMQNLRDKQSLV